MKQSTKVRTSTSRSPTSGVIDVDGIKIPDNRNVISDKVRFSMQNGRYEVGEVNKALGLLGANDRVLELGAGIGFVSAAVCKLGNPESYLAIEANPELIPVIEETWKLNKVTRAKALNGLVTRDGGATRDFYVRPDFWGSSMAPNSRPHDKVISVPEICASDIVKEFKPTMLIVDIEGGEEVLFDWFPLDKVEKIVLELHPRFYGRSGVGRINRQLTEAGFLPEPETQNTPVRIFTRAAMRALPGTTRRGAKVAKPGKTAPALIANATAPRTMLATCVQDTGPFFLEWLAWTKAIGVSDIVVFSGGSSAETLALLDCLDDLGEVTHLPNPLDSTDLGAYNSSALEFAKRMPTFRQADYFFSCGADEFLNVRVGDGTLASLYRAAGDFDALSVSEMNHDCNKREFFEDGWVTRQFPMHQTEYPGGRKSRRGVRTIVRISEDLIRIGDRRPEFHTRKKQPLMWRDGSGVPVREFFEDANCAEIDCRARYNLAAVNRYEYRSLDDYIIKIQHGNSGQQDPLANPELPQKLNENVDISCQPTLAMAGADAEYVRLIGDAGLKRCQDACSDAYARAVKSLEGDPDATKIRKRLKKRSW